MEDKGDNEEGEQRPCERSRRIADNLVRCIESGCSVQS